MNLTNSNKSKTNFIQQLPKLVLSRVKNLIPERQKLRKRDFASLKYWSRSDTHVSCSISMGRTSLNVVCVCRVGEKREYLAVGVLPPTNHSLLGELEYKLLVDG